MELSIQKIAVISFFVIGMSHIVQARAWAEFFIMLRRKGVTGVFIIGLLHLPIGALIVSFHNVWAGIPMLLTIIGWGNVLKSFVYFTFPTHGLRMLSRVSVERSWEFVVAGVVSVMFSGLLMFSLLDRS